jgi:protein involved in ribonucleotide reduction
MKVVYFSNYSGNTKRFIDKLDAEITRIPIKDATPVVSEPYILGTPTYGAGSDNNTVPRQVVAFLNIEENRNNLIGIIGFGNTNFGTHFCKAANLVSQKTGKPVLDKVEIFGLPEDVIRIQNLLDSLDAEAIQSHPSGLSKESV